MTISEGISRRTWLAGAAATAMSGAMPSAAQAARRRKAGDKINIAVIGAGGMGAANASRLTGENIVAACDVDFDHVAKSLLGRDGNTNPERVALRAAYDKAEHFSDYRKLFDKRKDIEAVLIATPDHHHAVAAKMAMERGLHVYVQKPLTYTVAESRMLAELARKNPKLVTQMGNQGHSGDDGRRVVELLRGGAIGTVREVHAWTNRPIWPQGIARPEPVAKPASLDWDLWLGPASVDWGYHPDYAHFNWRGWTPFGTGALGDMGAHLLDFPVWALEPGLPTRVETRHSRWASRDQPAQPGSWPLAGLTFFEFGNAKGGPVKLTWYDGGLMPPSPRDLPAEAVMSPEGGVLYVGDQGMLMHETYGEKPVVFGAGAAERAAAVPRSLPRIEGGLQGHERNWLAAIRGETRASCPFAYATTLNETMLLGMVALRAGRPITYDGSAARITDAADANTLLTRDYRSGWTI